MIAPKANYTFFTVFHEPLAPERALYKFVCIIDQGGSTRSVTNDIENIIEWLNATENITPKDHSYIFRDSDGNWDGYDYPTSDFIMLGGVDHTEAIEKYIRKFNCAKDISGTTHAERVNTFY